LYREYLKDFQMAKKHYRNAIAISIRNSNDYRLSQAYNNISLVFSREGIMDSAFYYLKKTKKIKEKIGDVGGLAITHNSLGSLYAQNGDFSKAIASFDETIRISEDLGIVPGLFYGNFGKGNTYMMMKSNREALIFYNRALKIAETLEDLEIRKAIHEKLFEIYKSNQNFEKALESYEKLGVIKDSLHAELMQETLSDIRIKYETNLAQQENLILREKELAQQEVIEKQNAILYILVAAVLIFVVMVIVLLRSYQQRNRAYQTLRFTSKELEQQYEKVKKQENELKIRNGLKDKIFSVLGHDLRTPMVNIMGLLDSVSKVEKNKEEFYHILNLLKNETSITLKNLQNILQWSQLQINDKVLIINEIDEDKVIKEILNSCRPLATAKEVKVSYINLKQNPFHADENQFKSIVTNLLTNAIKFSPKHSEVTVKFIEESLQFVLEITDTGSGIATSTVHNLLSGKQVIGTKGTSGEMGTGIGLSIVRDFVKLHKGQLEFMNNFPTGTIVRVCFPKEDEVSEV
ncbi:MAG TPA: tetratricopeptide repeat-containing sensor histidine kinase, partial [Flavobacteriaceae bacterium]|nr:tetratricopeptide repeat-containing sensor histidine kinase [Flavobacteriaceae bacterium]